MANSSAVLPACPRCKNRSVTPLVKDAGRQRFECQRCGDTFWSDALPDTPAAVASTPFVPVKIEDRTGEPMAVCSKCEKPYFKLGKRWDQHVATCDGKTKYVAPKPRARRTPIDRVLAPSAAEVYTRSIEALRARKAALEAEVRGIDVAIAEVEEKLKGAGGAAPAPFSSGGLPTP